MTEELKKQSTGGSLWRGTRRAAISNQGRGHAADTQIPLRCSSPAKSEAQPDLCRKRCPKGEKQDAVSSFRRVGSEIISSTCKMHPRRSWEKGQQLQREKNGSKWVLSSRQLQDEWQIASVLYFFPTLVTFTNLFARRRTLSICIVFSLYATISKNSIFHYVPEQQM